MTTTLERPTTNQINGVDTAALTETVDAVRENPEMGHCEFRVHNEWVKGDSNRSSTQEFYAACGEQTPG